MAAHPSVIGWPRGRLEVTADLPDEGPKPVAAEISSKSLKAPSRPVDREGVRLVSAALVVTTLGGRRR